jgi:catechol 2,3-dioxygenase
MTDGASDRLVGEALYLDDPEGNGAEIRRDRPREERLRAEDGTVEMATEPLDVEGVAAAASDGNGAGSEALVERAPPGTDVGHVHLELTSLAAFEAVDVDGLASSPG